MIIGTLKVKSLVFHKLLRIFDIPILLLLLSILLFMHFLSGIGNLFLFSKYIYPFVDLSQN